MKNMNNENWKVISVYTTKQAVADGVLIRVDDSRSQEAGIKYPVYLSLGVFTKYVQVPAGYEVNRIARAVFLISSIRSGTLQKDVRAASWNFI